MFIYIDDRPHVTVGCQRDEPNPEFKTRFVIDYMFEQQQDVMFEVYDRDSQTEDLSKQEYIGHATTTVGYGPSSWLAGAAL